MNESFTKILLVEDNPGDVRLIQLMLAEAAAGERGEIFEVIQVARLSQALTQVKETRFDLVLLDLSLPDSDGLATIRQILEAAPRLPVVILSGWGDQGVALEAVKAGAQDYLVKDHVNEYSLPRAIHYALARKLAEEELRRRNRELALLNQIIAASAADLEPATILEIACRELATTFELPHATVTLLDETRTATLIAAQYPTEAASVPSGITIPIVDDTTLLYLSHHKAPLVANQARSDPRLASLHPILHQHGVASLLILPLLIRNELGGSLSLESFSPHTFSSEEIHLAWSVADQLATVLARARLVQTHQRLIAAIEQVTENILITDTEGKILYVNPGFERLTGYSREEVLGRTPRLLKSGQQTPAAYRELWDTISAGQVWQGRLINKKKDGSLYTEEATITPVRDKNGSITNYVAVKRDVTRELQLEEQYRQARKLEALGRLTGGIAHDFNNLLTAIIGFAELAVLQYSPDDPQRELIDKVLHSSQRAADLVRQLLIFSRKQVVEPKTLNLNENIAELNKMLGRIIGEHIELDTRLSPGLGLVRIDPSQLVQIIVNLAVNSRDAMPGGGRLTIETANVELDETYMATHLRIQPGEYILLAITDTGTGMSQEVQDHIFEPFFTTKGAAGTGLGLATVYGIVEQNGGSIWVYSEEGQGTAFKIYLPRTHLTTPNTGTTRTKDELPTGTETILLVEDNEAVRSLFSTLLRSQGYTLLLAQNGQEGLTLAESYKQPIHLLITDIVMPYLNGKLLAEQLSQARPELKVIFMSGYTDHTIGEIQPGATFLQKPLSPITLARKIRQVLDTP